MAKEVEGKTDQEVAKYAAVFFKRFREIKNWESHLRKIDKGEQLLQRKTEIANALNKKVTARCPCGTGSRSVSPQSPSAYRSLPQPTAAPHRYTAGPSAYHRPSPPPSLPMSDPIATPFRLSW